MTRPETATVRVTDFGASTGINPQPIKIEEDQMELLDEFLSPRKLRALTGVDNLEDVDFLEMQVDADGASLGNFGMYLPNLRQLKLSNSIIGGVRDLGTSLNNLEVLWMPRCCLECLDGLVSMSNLRELYLAYNEIRDVSPCGMLECLEILDLEGNIIADYRSLSFLSLCEKLQRLSLEGNPLCLTLPEEEQKETYRSLVIRTIPQLKYLDDIPVSPGTCTASSTGGSDDVTLSRGHLPAGTAGDGSHEDIGAKGSGGLHTATLEFDAHWEYINCLLKDTGLMAESEHHIAAMTEVSATPADVDGLERGMSPLATGRYPPRTPGSVSMNSSYTGRPGSSLRPSTSQKRSGSSRGGRLGTASSTNSGSVIRPLSSTSGASLEDSEATDESGLTAGTVVCGNISKALRMRKHPTTPTTPSSFSGPLDSGVDTDRSSLRSRPGSSTSLPGGYTPGSLHRPATAAARVPHGGIRVVGRGVRPLGCTREETGVSKGARVETEEHQDFGDVLRELKEWRENYNVTRIAVEAERAPQIMTISHDECIDLSCSSHDSSTHSSPLPSDDEDYAPGPERSHRLHTNQASSDVAFTGSVTASSTVLLGATGGGGAQGSPPLLIGGDGINKHRVVPQIPSSKQFFSTTAGIKDPTRPATAMPSLGGKLKLPLSVLPSKPSVPKP